MIHKLMADTHLSWTDTYLKRILFDVDETNVAQMIKYPDVFLMNYH